MTVWVLVRRFKGSDYVAVYSDKQKAISAVANITAMSGVTPVWHNDQCVADAKSAGSFEIQEHKIR